MEKEIIYWISKNILGVAWYYPSLREWYIETASGVKTNISNPKKSKDFVVLK